MPQNKKQIAFDQIVAALLNEDEPFSPTFLHRFSDLEGKDLNTLKQSWVKINPDRKANLMLDLEEMLETDTRVSFDNLARIALEDKDARVRQIAIRLLGECDDTRLVPVFINLLERDLDTDVRAAAAQGLGRFVYLGELDEIPERIFHSVEDCLLGIPESAPEIIRQRVLESLGFSSRDEVPQMMLSAYNHGSEQWLASALLAMGRSADPRWDRLVVDMLDHSSSEVRAEAIRAAGELELKSARQPLLELLSDYRSLEEEIFAATAWSLSQIGGDQVRAALEALSEQAEGDDEADFLEDVLENLEFNENFSTGAMLEILEDELSNESDEMEDPAEEDEN